MGWLLGNVEALLQGEGLKEFVKSSRVGSRSFITHIAQGCTNCHSQFLALAKNGGGGRRAFIIKPKGCEGKGWRSCTLELRKAFSFFQLSFGDGFRVLPPCKPLGGFLLKGVDGSTTAAKDKALVEVVGKRLYAVGSGQSPAIHIACKGSEGISNFRERRGWDGNDGGGWGSVRVSQVSRRLYHV